jgi:DNA recombination protein RmuC
MLEIILVVLLVAVLGVVVWVLINLLDARRESAAQSGTINSLTQQLESVRTSQEALRQGLDKSLQAGQENVWKSLEKQHQVMTQLNQQIGELQGAGKQLVTLNTDVRRLHEILSSPKLRGQLGEWSLERLLGELLPRDSFELQYQFADGRRVDALIKLSDFSVPIDAKFPLPSFEAILKCENNGELPRLQKQFCRDVMSHIDKISDSYIRPAEGTLDFALMYIPAENVYYETIIRYDCNTTSLVDYAMSKKVIPVSPNVLYAYVMTIVMGLRGLQIEKQAAQIRENLKRLDGGYSLFAADFKTLGSHIRNTANKFDDADKKLSRFESQMTQIIKSEE